jgi:FtsH-binding integral membrane protein
MAKAKKLHQAVERAEDAADRAEKAAVRPRYWLIAGLSFALVGAVLAFALKAGDPSVLGVSLRPFGGVLFAAGVLLVACAGISSIGDGDSGASADGIKSVGGLIAVVVGISAVTALTIVTLTQLGTDSKDSAVAVTSSAFGIISAVVGAYLGIKISSDNTAKVSGDVKAAAVSDHVAHVATSELEAVEEIITPEQTAAIDAARKEAREGAIKAPNPHSGGGGA